MTARKQLSIIHYLTVYSLNHLKVTNKQYNNSVNYPTLRV